MFNFFLKKFIANYKNISHQLKNNIFLTKMIDHWYYNAYNNFTKISINFGDWLFENWIIKGCVGGD